MRKFLFVLPVLFAVISCGPSTYTMAIDSRKPSTSGMDIAGKTLSVVYLTDGTAADSLFQAKLAEGFASGLESELFEGKQSIGMYSMPYLPESNYSCRDTLVNLVMDTGTDVVFLFGKTARTLDGLPYEVILYSYDSCDKKDAVYAYSGKSSSSALSAGKEIARSYVPQWKTEGFTLFFYDTESWIQPLYFAESFLWEKAIILWIKLLDTKDVQKRSCAEYNLSLACYMLEQYDLALEWLNRSIEDSENSLQDGMRKRILERKKQAVIK